MRPLLYLIAALLLLPVAAFCAYGVLATLEPSTRPGVNLAFRVGYAVTAVVCLGGSISFLAMGARHMSGR